MTDAKWVRDLLRAEWDESSEFCEKPTPQPDIQVEGEKDQRSVHYGDNDVAFTKDGDIPIVEPQSVGYNEQRVETVVDIELITGVDRERLTGLASENYGGMVGEVERIIDKYRLGVPSDGPVSDPGYNVIIKDTFRDEIGERGGGQWAGTWTITFITYATSIEQPAANRFK